MLHISICGVFNHVDSLPVWQQVFELSHQTRPLGILIELTLHADRISMDHCFEIIERLPLICRLLDCKIAVFGKKAGNEARELLKFVETASRDRGARVRLFDALEDAKLWLEI
jgi:hypothetical protein